MADARTYGRRFREIGLNSAWFGILNGLIVASGKPRHDLEPTFSIEKLKDVPIPRSSANQAY